MKQRRSRVLGLAICVALAACGADDVNLLNPPSLVGIGMGVLNPVLDDGPVPTDGPYSWRTPRSTADFTTLGLGSYVPSHLYQCQELSGTLADTSGAVALATQFATYANTVAGWARKGVGVDKATAKSSVYMSAGQGANLATQSWAMLVYLHVEDASATGSSHFFNAGLGDPDTENLALFTPTSGSGLLSYRSENVSTVAGVYDCVPADLAYLVVFNRNAGTTKVYTSLGDKIIGGYSGATLVDGYKVLLGTVPVASGSPVPITGKVMWGAMWDGVAAQIDDAGALAIMNGLGISTIWQVTVDGPAHNLIPLTTAEWASCDVDQFSRVGRHLITPDSAWGFQETVTPVDDKIGSLDLAVVFATMNSAISITGWSRKCLSFSAGGSHGQASLASGVGPNPATTSVMWIGLYTTIVATTLLRQIMMIGGTTTANEASININTIANGSELQGKVLAAFTDDAAAFVAATPMLIAFRYDRTAGTATIFTKDRKFTVTYSGSVVDGFKGFGGQIQNTPAFKLTHGFMYSAANAEQSDQQVYDMFTTLMRVAPAWSP